jgi:hypothetical protein
MPQPKDSNANSREGDGEGAGRIMIRGLFFFPKNIIRGKISIFPRIIIFSTAVSVL